MCEISGRSRGSCGYCKGSKGASRSDGAVDKSSDSPGEARGRSHSYGLLFSEVGCRDYLDMLDGGWRRSGRYLYLPDNQRSCCCSHTIRLSTDAFVKDAEQRKVWRKGWGISGGSNGRSSKVKRKGTGGSDGDATVAAALSKGVLSALAALEADGGCDRILLKGQRFEQLKATLAFGRFKKGGGNSSKRPAFSCAAPVRLEGMSRGEVKKSQVLALLREALQSPTGAVCLSRALKDSVGCGVGDVAFRETGHVIVTLEGGKNEEEGSDKRADAVGDNMKATTTTASNSAGLCVTVVPSRESAKDPEVHRLYCKYQKDVHGDADPYEGFEGADLDEAWKLAAETEAGKSKSNGKASKESKTGDGMMCIDDDLKFDESKVQSLKKSYRSFKAFLCDSPLKHVKIDLDRQAASSKAFAAGVVIGNISKDKDKDKDTAKSKGEKSGRSKEDNVGVYYTDVPNGSYHFQYRFDGALLAVGVIDILPHCLSSVYCFYERKLSGSVKGVSMGKFTAMYEIEWARRKGINEGVGPYWYYMGYYIHDCHKMVRLVGFKMHASSCYCCATAPSPSHPPPLPFAIQEIQGRLQTV